jgi:hypothetical protein
LAHNLAFDAVINAMLCRQFPSEASFFAAINGWDEFPGRLLRPPPGWPDAPQLLPAGASTAERKVHAMLYGSERQQVTYHELFELLLEEFAARRGEEGNGDGRLDEDGERAGAVLLGDHDGERGAGGLDDIASRDDTLKGVMSRIVEGWPPSPRQLAGRADGGSEQDWRMTPTDTPAALLRAAMRRLLSRAGITAGAARARRRLAQIDVSISVGTVRPQARDRRAHAWARLHGAPPLLWRGVARQTRWRPQPRPLAHVYLDISGSMNAALPILWAALREPHRTGAIRLFVFSTVIDEARPGDLSKQHFKNTFGTNIRCVLEHLAGFSERKRPARVVLLTDGYVGAVTAADLKRLQVSLFVGHYAAFGPDSASDLARVARHIEVLPGLPG